MFACALYKQLTVRYDGCVYLCRSSIKRQITLVVKLNRFRLCIQHVVSVVFTRSLSLSTSLPLSLALFVFFLSFTHVRSAVRLLVLLFSSHTSIHAHTRTHIVAFVIRLFTLILPSYRPSNTASTTTTAFTCTHANNQLLCFAVLCCALLCFWFSASVHFRIK